MECLKDLQAEIKMSENAETVTAEFTALMIYERFKKF